MPQRGQYLVIWRFEIGPGAEADFRAIYGPDGDWVKLFRQDEAYFGTELIQDIASPHLFLTLDSWRSQEAYDRFRREHCREYEQFDSRCERLTVREQEIGRFASAQW